MIKEINREILRLAIPSILANITVPLVGMIDIAVAGHLTDIGSATLIGGIAIGSTLFDLLYWNFAFLRVGTGGLTAQAFGSKDNRRCAQILFRGVSLSLLFSVLLIAVQWLFLNLAFLFIDCSDQVRQLACRYFNIRIWAAPATLSLMALKGWFIGMQDSFSSMVTDIVVNGVNIAGSIIFTMGLGSWKGMGYDGIALGTVVAQYTGLFTSFCFIIIRYRGLFRNLSLSDIKGLMMSNERKSFASMNMDLFIRSLCFISIYIGQGKVSEQSPVTDYNKTERCK